MEDKIFIVPNNDGEALAIIDLLKQNGYEEGKNLFITEQGWGASWKGLEPEIKNAIRNAAQRNEVTEFRSDGYSYSGSGRVIIQGNLPEIEPSEHVGHGYTGPIEPLAPDFSHIYGVELQGKTMCNNIDHHIYEGDDRSNPKSSIEQVADLIGIELSIEQQFIAANDRGFIPEMESLGEMLMLEQEEISEHIQNTRALDRNAQGITQEQEHQAERAILETLTRNGNLTIVELPHSKCATVTDRLYGQYENMLIICADGELDFYGKGEICKQLQEQFQGWSGGDLDNSGFWGGYANPEEVKQFIDKGMESVEKIPQNSIDSLKPEISSVNTSDAMEKLLSLRSQLSSAIEEIDSVIGKNGQIQQNISTHEKQAKEINQNKDTSENIL